MKSCRIYGIATISKYLGTVQAETKKEALEKADTELSNKMHISICHHCSREMGDSPEITEIQAEED